VLADWKTPAKSGKVATHKTIRRQAAIVGYSLPFGNRDAENAVLRAPQRGFGTLHNGNKQSRRRQRVQHGCSCVVR